MYRYIIPLAMLMAACMTDEGDTPDSGPQLPTASAPVTLSLSTDWDNEPTRAMPPGTGSGSGSVGETVTADNGETETQNIDQIRVVTFRRKAKDGLTASQNFVYDDENSHILTISTTASVSPDDLNHNTHTHKTATFNLKKTYGYEYRVVALAYSTTRRLPFDEYRGTGDHDWDHFRKQDSQHFQGDNATGEQHFFGLNVHDGLTLDQFKATIYTETVPKGNKDNKHLWQEFICGFRSYANPVHADCIASEGNLVCPPQLFWGELTAATSRSNIIPFAEETDAGQESNLPLRGVLKRGMAKVEVNIARAVKHNFDGPKHNVIWVALMADNVQREIHLDSYDRFASFYGTQGNGTYRCIDVKKSGDMRLFAWLIPGKTNIAVRIRYDVTITGALGNRSVVNGHILLNNATSGGTPTGVISPDVGGDQIYLRRNHKYVINIDNTNDAWQHEID